ncbi:MAG TPA: HAMP domain-containing sensor histidine kinase [Sphingobacteriaceae bacterium]|nr:HAMP domain-containing sensor histidine kinase [Sphingobacteriaceae bacterium]
MTIALLGVMAMQYYFIVQSFNLKAKLFDESVIAALSTVALKAEKNEALHFINEKERQEIQSRRERQRSLAQSEEQNQSRKYAEGMRMQRQQLQSKFKLLEKEVRRRHPGAVLIDNDFYETYIKDPRYRPFVQYEASVRHEMDGKGQLFQQQDFGIYVTKTAPVIRKAKDDSVRYFVIDPSVGEMIISLPPRVDARLESEIRRYEQQAKAKVAASYIDSIRANAERGSSAIQILANEFERSKRSLGQRIDTKFIVEQLREELEDRNIPLDFDLKISKGQRDSVLYQMANDANNGAEGNQYSTVLFPNEFPANGAVISIYFPNKTSILMGNAKVMLFSSVALILVLISSFTYIILTILRQKKLSEMKTDFINNMTHEFKTPVATIMIASESLKDPEIMEDKARVKRLAGIIYDENIRLGDHIERVLNIARIDKGDLELEKETINVNDLIEGVVDSMDLQLKRKNAEIKLKLEATNAVVLGDELHLSNVIFNLLDNAIKYRNKESNIEIITKNRNHSLYINIIDDGIGMSKEQLTKIFDQFYRVPTGNLHDVKGFGLGLSYVQDIVKRMNGTVKAKSELNKGTEFEIILPLKD